jgi:dTDP-4-amino-4,6-dideoxygalactose transaminase
MLETTFPSWPSFSIEEAEAVHRVLLSNRVNYWTGEECRKFETEFAERTGVPHAVSLNNGTVALEMAVRALNIRPGDEVIVTPRSFLASTSCIVSSGAIPIFADVSRDTQNITVDTIARVLSPRTRMIIPVHLAGMPCDMDPIVDLAKAHGLSIIEDCAQAHGARYKNRSVGSIGDIGAWSFCQDKIITTAGEGGMITTGSHALWSAIWSEKDHGKNWAAVHAPQKTKGYRWVHESFGTNGRMLEVQAAVGRIQLRKMGDWSAARRRNADRIWNTARRMTGLRAPEVPIWAEHGAYKAYVFIEPDAIKSGWSRDRVVAEINARGVPCYTGSCPEIYLEKAFDGTGWRPPNRLPVARELGETSLMFLVHPTLNDANIDQTCDVLDTVLNAAVI